MSRYVCAGVLLLVAMGLRPTLGGAQDIEAVAKARGITLPAAYYAQIQAEPRLYEFQNGLFNRSGPARTPATGEVRIPVVLGLFSDSPLEPIVSRDDVQRALFDGPAERGTITDAYLEMSLGQLTVAGDVYGWARSDLTMTQVVGTDRSFGPDNRVGEWLVDVLEELDPEVDFTQYDNDGPDGIPNSGDDDGVVDVITFEFLEVSASCGGPAIWPHRSTLQGRSGAAFVTDDTGIGGEAILVQDYITQSATDCTGGMIQDAAVITHEFGHALGLPDWYHWVDSSIGPEGRRWVMGCWALMAAGSWGCGPVGDRVPFGPTHMLGYSKEWLGWIDYTEIGEVWNAEYELSPIQTSGEVLRIPLDDSGAENLIIEFRDQVGFDHQIPAKGVLMYHHDENAALRPDPASTDPYFLSMIEQDANGSLLRTTPEGGNRGEPGDAWGVDGVLGRLHAETSPRLRTNAGAWTSVQVHEVIVDGDVARVVLSTGKTPQLVAPVSTLEVMQVRSFVAEVRIAGGVGPYVGVGDLPEGFTLTAAGDQLHLIGSLRDAGAQDFEIAVRDAEGAESASVVVSVSATEPWVVDVDALYRTFLLSPGDPLTPGESAYLDDLGNANGRYDVGDLRKWLREAGS